ncbi:MAG: hypothetical protein U0414_18605 [Polyangiaceae bacterium]
MRGRPSSLALGGTLTTLLAACASGAPGASVTGPSASATANVRASASAAPPLASAPSPGADDDRPLDAAHGCVVAGRVDLNAIVLDPACKVPFESPEIRAWMELRVPSPFKTSVVAAREGIRIGSGGDTFPLRVRIENPGEELPEVLIPPDDRAVRAWFTSDARGIERTSANAGTHDWARVRWDAHAIGYFTLSVRATYATEACTPTVVVGGVPTHARTWVDVPLPMGKYQITAVADFRMQSAAGEFPPEPGPFLFIEYRPEPTLFR